MVRLVGALHIAGSGWCLVFEAKLEGAGWDKAYKIRILQINMYPGATVHELPVQFTVVVKADLVLIND